MTQPPYSPFERDTSKAIVEDARQRERRASLLAALGSPIGIRWLELRLAEEAGRPSYMPGDDHATTAWREGRKAMLRDLYQELKAAMTRGAD
jgi:hypothetical protein